MNKTTNYEFTNGYYECYRYTGRAFAKSYLLRVYDGGRQYEAIYGLVNKEGGIKLIRYTTPDSTWSGHVVDHATDKISNEFDFMLSSIEEFAEKYFEYFL
jgi:hypothetical protein